MEVCPKCSNKILIHDTNMIVQAEQPWKKIQAKICSDCDFVEFLHN